VLWASVVVAAGAMLAGCPSAVLEMAAGGTTSGTGSTSTSTSASTFTSESDPRHGFASRQRARHTGASNGSAKYCVSRATLPSRNSMMLTVGTGRPS